MSRGERSQSSSPAKPSRSRGDAAGVHGQRRSPSKAKASALGQRSHLRDDGPQAVQRVRIGASSHFKGTPLVCCRIVETSVRSNPNVACDAIVSPAGNEIIYVAPDDAVLDGFVDSGRFLGQPACSPG